MLTLTLFFWELLELFVIGIVYYWVIGIKYHIIWILCLGKCTTTVKLAWQIWRLICSFFEMVFWQFCFLHYVSLLNILNIVLYMPGGVFSKEQEVKILSFVMIVAIKYIMRVTKKQNLRVNKILDKCTSSILIKNCSSRLVTYLCDGLKKKV